MLQKLFWPFTVRIGKLFQWSQNSANSWPSASITRTFFFSQKVRTILGTKYHFSHWKKNWGLFCSTKDLESGSEKILSSVRRLGIACSLFGPTAKCKVKSTNHCTPRSLLKNSSAFVKFFFEITFKENWCLFGAHLLLIYFLNLGRKQIKLYFLMVS